MSAAATVRTFWPQKQKLIISEVMRMINDVMGMISKVIEMVSTAMGMISAVTMLISMVIIVISIVILMISAVMKMMTNITWDHDQNWLLSSNSIQPVISIFWRSWSIKDRGLVV